MNERLARIAILPLHERLRGRDTLAHYRELRAGDLRSPEALQALRLDKLRELVAHCLAHVPFHRERLRAAGITDARAVDFGDLARLPALERADIRAHRDDLCADDHGGRLIRYTTGGSTGEPLVFFTDGRKEARHNAHKLRYRAWHGVRPGMRQMDFWGSPIEMDKQTRLRVAKDRYLLNQRLLSAFDLTDERLGEYVRILSRFRPRLIYGYPTVIHRVAQRALAEPQSLRGWRPRLVACTAEMLLDHQRATIERAFDCPVANEYGSRDAGIIAYECPAGALHLAAEHVHVEVAAPDADGVGELLVTNLDARGMPLLRYRVGDRASLGTGACDCGRPQPLLRAVAGRANDFLVGGGGKLVHSLAAIYVLREVDGLRQFRVHQGRDGALTVQLVTDAELPPDTLVDLQVRLQRVLEREVPVSFDFPAVIAPERSGKYRSVVSEAISGAAS